MTSSLEQPNARRQLSGDELQKIAAMPTRFDLVRLRLSFSLSNSLLYQYRNIAPMLKPGVDPRSS